MPEDKNYCFDCFNFLAQANQRPSCRLIVDIGDVCHRCGAIWGRVDEPPVTATWRRPTALEVMRASLGLLRPVSAREPAPGVVVKSTRSVVG
jgi:hypothetical protein